MRQSSSGRTPQRLGLRIFLAAAALGSLAWTLGTFRDVATIEPFDDIAERIALGDQFRPEAVKRVLPFVEAAEKHVGCSRLFHDAAMIRVQARRIALTENDRAQADKHLVRAIDDLEKDLACAPTRSMSWLLLFAMRSAADGNAATHLPLLGMSYQMAANDGSVSPLRVRAALPLLASFGPNMRSYVENDFTTLVREQVRTASAIYAEAPANTLQELARLVRQAPLDKRLLFNTGLEMLQVPDLPDLNLPRP